MNKKIIIAMLACMPLFTYAQLGGFFNKVKNKATAKLTQRVDNKIDKSMDRTLDKAEGVTSPTKQQDAAVTEEATGTKATPAPGEKTVGSFTKYDFIPGKEIVYYDNFEQEALAELPTGWNTNGSGEIVTLDKYPGKWLRLHKQFTYLTANTKAFSENFTAEFDVVLQLKNNGWLFPEFTCGLFAAEAEGTTDNIFLREYNKYSSVAATLFPATGHGSKLQLASFDDNKSYFKSEMKEYGQLESYYGKPVHVAIQVQQSRFRIWINETKAFDAPKAVPADKILNQLFFKVSPTNYSEEQYAMYVSNIKIAKGVEDTRHRLVEEGKFSTTAILFDVNTATLKPESFGAIKEIATVLKEHSDIKITIIGHTDSDGSDAANLTLSQQRSAAVKEALVNEFSMDGARIETEGKGETKPIADNKIKEGKAMNRRVEFIKQ